MGYFDCQFYKLFLYSAWKIPHGNLRSEFKIIRDFNFTVNRAQRKKKKGLSILKFEFRKSGVQIKLSTRFQMCKIKS